MKLGEPARAGQKVAEVGARQRAEHDFEFVLALPRRPAEGGRQAELLLAEPAVQVARNVEPRAGELAHFNGNAEVIRENGFEPIGGACLLREPSGARGLTELHSLVRLYTNDEWAWQVRLLMRDAENIRGMRLGRINDAASSGIGDGASPAADGGATADSNRLGWTSWLSTRRAGAEDVVIQDTRVSAAPHSTTSGARPHG